MLFARCKNQFHGTDQRVDRKYNENSFRYAQTAGKTEQIALCSYIRDGHIKSQTRKIRRLYSAKAKTFAGILKKLMPDAEIEIGENTLQIILVTQFYKPSGEFEKAGLKVFIEKYQDNKIILVISPSGIPSGKLETAARSLTDVIISKQKTV